MTHRPFYWTIPLKSLPGDPLPTRAEYVNSRGHVFPPFLLHALRFFVLRFFYLFPFYPAPSLPFRNFVYHRRTRKRGVLLASYKLTRFVTNFLISFPPFVAPSTYSSEVLNYCNWGSFHFSFLLFFFSSRETRREDSSNGLIK